MSLQRFLWWLSGVAKAVNYCKCAQSLISAAAVPLLSECTSNATRMRGSFREEAACPGAFMVTCVSASPVRRQVMLVALARRGARLRSRRRVGARWLLPQVAVTTARPAICQTIVPDMPFLPLRIPADVKHDLSSE